MAQRESFSPRQAIERLVRDVFTDRIMKIEEAVDYKKTLLGTTIRLVLLAPSGEKEVYFLKTVVTGAVSAQMCEGEYESLKAIHDVVPSFAPRPVSWGQMVGQPGDSYYILEEFRNITDELASAKELASGLAEIHLRSQSPTGKFGFHVKTCHGPIVQQVDQWESCWSVFYQRHLRQYMETASPIMADAEYDNLCQTVLNEVVPRLLLPLQEEGRVLRPALVHGDCWDGNTALDQDTGKALVFDACSFYGHNEYDIGNWRAPRHRLSAAEYVDAYKQCYPVSEPAEDWEARNVLYSLSFNIGNICNIPNSDQREPVMNDMKWLCANVLPDGNQVTRGAVDTPKQPSSCT